MVVVVVVAVGVVVVVVVVGVAVVVASLDGCRTCLYRGLLRIPAVGVVEDARTGGCLKSP